MNSNFKRKLLAGIFAPVLGLTVGSAIAQSTAPGAATTTSPSAGTTTTPSAGMQSDEARKLNPNTSNKAANPGSMWNAQHFDRVDKNRDGRISKEEAEADSTMKSEWSKLDTANRGSVSREDFDGYARKLNPNTGGSPMGSNAQRPGTTTTGTTTTK